MPGRRGRSTNRSGGRKSGRSPSPSARSSRRFVGGMSTRRTAFTSLQAFEKAISPFPRLPIYEGLDVENRAAFVPPPTELSAELLGSSDDSLYSLLRFMAVDQALSDLATFRIVSCIIETLKTKNRLLSFLRFCARKEAREQQAEREHQVVHRLLDAQGRLGPSSRACA